MLLQVLPPGSDPGPVVSPSALLYTATVGGEVAGQEVELQVQALPTQSGVLPPHTSQVAPQWAAVSLASDATLCLAVSEAKNKYGSFELIVDACGAPPPPAQLFAFDAANGTLATLGGGGDAAPVCVDVTANNYTVGNALDVFACQPANNQRWRLLEGGLLSSGDPAEFYCMGACAA